MKWILTETKDDTNETTMWEYETEEDAIENIKHMKIAELQPYLGIRTIRLFKAEEVDISGVTGYRLDELSRKE